MSTNPVCFCTLITYVSQPTRSVTCNTPRAPLIASYGNNPFLQPAGTSLFVWNGIRWQIIPKFTILRAGFKKSHKARFVGHIFEFVVPCI